MFSLLACWMHKNSHQWFGVMCLLQSVLCFQVVMSVHCLFYGIVWPSTCVGVRAVRDSSTPSWLLWCWYYSSDFWVNHVVGLLGLSLWTCSIIAASQGGWFCKEYLAHLLMVHSGVVLHPVIGMVCFSLFPIKLELLLLIMISEPAEVHIHGFCHTGDDFIGVNTIHCRVVSLHGLVDAPWIALDV